MRHLIGAVVIVGGFLLSALNASAQGPRSDRPDFSALRDRRAQLISEVDAMRDEISRAAARQLPPSVEIEGYLRRATEDVDKLKQRIAEARRRGAPTEPLEKEIPLLEQNAMRYDADLKLKRNAEVQQVAMTKKQLELATLETQINDALNRDVVLQDFKTKVSYVFSVLVGMMIVGFFTIAMRDDRIRQTIFSGEAGIQFVTLFSLVIAIILFGITGILGDKELSALLGGLSGYILGRSMHRTGTSGNAGGPA